MKLFFNSMSAAKSLTIFTVMMMLFAGVQAASILTLSGETEEVKHDSDREIRISVIDWSGEEAKTAVELAWKKYQQDNDVDAFLEILEAQESRGYLFTAAATGYRIKYAWQEESRNGQMMHFLVMPGLKTRNPYMWSTPNNDSPEFTLVQVQMDDETGVAKSSLDGQIVVNESGSLVLDRFGALSKFASLEDSTPFYLK